MDAGLRRDEVCASLHPSRALLCWGGARATRQSSPCGQRRNPPVVLGLHIWSGHVPPPATLGLVPPPRPLRRRRWVAPAGVVAPLPLHPGAAGARCRPPALTRHRPLPFARHRPPALPAHRRLRRRALPLDPGAPLARHRPLAVSPARRRRLPLDPGAPLARDRPLAISPPRRRRPPPPGRC